MRTEDILKLLDIAGTAALHAFDAYQQAKALAAQSGITPADLAAADARFARAFADPLAQKDGI